MKSFRNWKARRQNRQDAGLEWGRDLPRWQRWLIIVFLFLFPPGFGFMMGRLLKLSGLNTWTVVFIAAAVALPIGLVLRIVVGDLGRKARLQREQDAARRIQGFFNPTTLPQMPGFEISGLCRTFMEIGGDYYDAIPIDSKRVLLLVADVSGKGTAAALIMAGMHAIMQTQVDAQHGLKEIAQRVNTYLLHHTDQARFVTMIFGILDTDARELEYINAGHNPGLVITAEAKVEKLNVGGPPLGLLYDCHYESGRVSLPPRSLLLFYTDGLTERVNEHGEDYDEERVISQLRGMRFESTDSIVNSLVRHNDFFAASKEREDDLTVLVVKSLPPEIVFKTTQPAARVKL